MRAIFNFLLRNIRMYVLFLEQNRSTLKAIKLNVKLRSAVQNLMQISKHATDTNVMCKAVH